MWYSNHRRFVKTGNRECAGVAQSVEQLIRNQQVRCSSHPTSSKKKDMTNRSCPSFWVSRAAGLLHPSVIQMLGRSEFRLRRRPEGR